ncbi:hypothetical protein SAMN02787100_2700 [Chryseobacterium sp. OV279]|nr:hypothetical protein SAMN02787100_2700 [Chryseobacterium sp. OV279]
MIFFIKVVDVTVLIVWRINFKNVSLFFKCFEKQSDTTTDSVTTYYNLGTLVIPFLLKFVRLNIVSALLTSI